MHIQIVGKNSHEKRTRKEGPEYNLYIDLIFLFFKSNIVYVIYHKLPHFCLGNDQVLNQNALLVWQKVHTTLDLFLFL